MPKITQDKIDQGFAFELDASDCAEIENIDQFYEDWLVSAQAPGFIPDETNISDEVARNGFYSEFGRNESYFDIFHVASDYQLSGTSGKEKGVDLIGHVREKFFTSVGLTNIYLQNCIFFAARQNQEAPEKQSPETRRRLICQLFPSAQIASIFSAEGTGYLGDSMSAGSVFTKPDGDIRGQLKILRFDNDSKSGYVTCELDSYFFCSTTFGVKTQGKGVVRQTITFYADRSKPPKIEKVSCTLPPPLISASKDDVFKPRTPEVEKALSEFTDKVKSIVEMKAAKLAALTQATDADLEQIKNPTKGEEANKINSLIRNRTKMKNLFVEERVRNSKIINNATMLRLLKAIASNSTAATRLIGEKPSAEMAKNEMVARENYENALNRIFDRVWRHPFGYNFRNLLDKNDVLVKQIVEELTTLIAISVADASGAGTTAAAATVTLTHKYSPLVVFSILSRLNKLDMTKDTKAMVEKELQKVSTAIDERVAAFVSGRPVEIQKTSPSSAAQVMQEFGIKAATATGQQATDRKDASEAGKRSEEVAKQVPVVIPPVTTPRPVPTGEDAGTTKPAPVERESHRRFIPPLFS